MSSSPRGLFSSGKYQNGNFPAWPFNERIKCRKCISFSLQSTMFKHWKLLVSTHRLPCALEILQSLISSFGLDVSRYSFRPNQKIDTFFLPPTVKIRFCALTEWNWTIFAINFEFFALIAMLLYILVVNLEFSLGKLIDSELASEFSIFAFSLASNWMCLYTWMAWNQR